MARDSLLSARVTQAAEGGRGGGRARVSFQPWMVAVTSELPPECAMALGSLPSWVEAAPGLTGLVALTPRVGKSPFWN